MLWHLTWMFSLFLWRRLCERTDSAILNTDLRSRPSMSTFDRTVTSMAGSKRAEVASNEKNADMSWLRIRFPI